MITKTKKYLIPGLVCIFLLLMSNNHKIHSQILDSTIYWTDDAGAVPVCLGDTLNGTIYWMRTGTYNVGDEVDIIVDWGDGNTSSFLNLPIIPGSGYGYIDAVYPSHIYASNGSYTVIINSADNYLNSNADTSNYSVSNICGNLTTNVYLDNGDGILSWGDVSVPNVSLGLTSASTSYYASTNNYGYAQITNIDNSIPSYTLAIDPAWLSTSGTSVINPLSGNHTINILTSEYQSKNFLLDCDPGNYDGKASGSAWGFRSGFSTGRVVLFIENFDCSGTPVTGDISLDFDPLLNVYSSSLAGGAIASGNISWNNINLPLGNWIIELLFSVPAGTPAFTPLNFQVELNNTSSTDINPSNNIFSFVTQVRNSWDPNDKSTNVEHFIDVNTQEEIQYTIRFQNMGNDDAYDIHVVDTISNLLDLSTLKVVAQSHAGSYSVNPITREVIFNFPNINLVPQSTDELLSQGYIAYSIKENAGLPLNSEINNTAHIFFDGNAAVVTNTTSNVNIANVGMEDESPLSSVTVYPMPANTYVQIGGINLQDITGLKILDLNGKVIQIINANINASIQVSEIPNGLYLLEITSGTNSIVKKICIQH